MRLQKTTQSNQYFRSAVSFVSVLLLLFSSVSHIHVRYCLDGNEPAVSIHFESEEVHAQNVHWEQELPDVESEFSLDTILAKLELGSISVVAFNSFFYLSTPHSTEKTKPEFISPTYAGTPATLLPPSQAPPVIA